MNFFKTLFAALFFTSVIITVFILFSKEVQSPLKEKHAANQTSADSEEVKNETKKQAEREPLDVPLIKQMDPPKLYNGCEVASLAMILNYSGYDVTKNELAEKVKRVPLQYENGLKGNPNDGFVGDMENGPGLSVYHGPVYDLASSYAGNKAIDLTGNSPEAIYKQLNQGRPVWVITTVNFSTVNDMETWDTPTGTADVTYSVHSVAVTGYDEDYVYLNDPYGYKNRKADKTNFENSWEQMGSQAIVIAS
ncbi:C39 family peptidase [Bacillus swezeyi]|uniref:Peptidase C39-like domain-containing protein n=1 Tax=Bacillus swezeyi TaxID=1925020 RepID=A0A5M8RUI4_9BACI|nr:C39 family peptidase [Bacillus swezeyi]KAA6450776.1 hypothetical protein DX927_07980 [Bacillus swezeyi]KAA6475023.1 hypothetical protein DX928_13470 [Bacillus swezeyi]TYS37312.1 hypothetical protein FZC77_07815 [Bacillus swezeyi]